MTRSPSGGIRDLLVVVPARDEAHLLPACLAALDAAAAVLRALPGAPAVHQLVVLDRCRDGSARAVARWPGVVAVPSVAGSAGGARAAGVHAGLSVLDAAGVPPERVWVASTDADSRVPAGWLVHHREVADAGADLLLGTVAPSADDLPEPVRAPLLRAWADGYRAAEGHPHVHAANLGVRADAYRAAGGFPPVAAHEDVALARAVEARGGRVVRSARHPVTTSARLVGRAPEGFARHLAALGAALAR